jgi:glycosyltransferase involved in cell wall biosynthesis
MESLLVLFTYNRPQILKACIETCFGNTKYEFDEVLIINDGSRPETSGPVAQFVLANQPHPKTKFSLMHFGKNQGYSYAAEFAFNYAKWRNPKYFFFVEQDYVFRKGWAEDALAVLEAAPNTLALSGYSNPDFFDKSKTEVMFPQIIKEDFGEDICAREFMHNPFVLNTKRGDILVQGTSNSCGTAVVNWDEFMSFLHAYPEIWEKVIERACNMQAGGNRQNYGDGPFSHGLSHYFYKWHREMKAPEWFEKNFPWLDICDFSISNHINGGAESINGKIVPEGSTFVSSPRWNDEYLQKDPRQNDDTGTN